MPTDINREPKDISDYFSLCNSIIIILNIVVFLVVDLSYSSTNTDWMITCGALYWPLVLEKGEYFRLLTSMFLHFGIAHLLNNMLILWFIGGTLEKLTGHIRFLFLYFLSGILAGVISMGYNIGTGQAPVAAGASGAIFGTVGALLYLVIKSRGSSSGFSKRQMLVFLFLSLYGGFANQNVDNAAHIGGFISGFLLAFMLCHNMTAKK
ncbi:MAG: hypothetical protein PWP24_35 [Clostridiales bacterium]|nr:hypothetical protein [Clostridiales bacterium]